MADEAQSSSGDRSTVSLSHVVSVIRHGWLTIVACALVGVLVGYALFIVTPAKYTARAALTIVSQDTGSGKDVSTATESAVVASTAVAERASAILGTPTSTSHDLLKNLSVSSPLDSEFLSISYTSSTRGGAAAGANAFAQAYLAFRSDSLSDILKAREKRLTDSLTALEVNLAKYRSTISSTKSSAQAVDQARAQLNATQSLVNSINSQLLSVQTTAVNPGELVDTAVPPTHRTFPSRVIFLFGGLVLGGVIGLVLVFARSSRGSAIATATDLENSSGAEVLAVVPVAGGRGAKERPLAVLSNLGGDEADAYRILASKLTARHKDKTRYRAYLMTASGEPLSGSSPLSLAVTLAAQGHRVALLGSLPAILRAASEVSPDVEPEAPSNDGLAVISTVGQLRLVSFGEEVALDTTLRRQSADVTRLMAGVDIVIIDGVNVQLPSTPLSLAKIADHALLVASRWRSSDDGVRHTTQDLLQVAAPLRGAILLAPSRVSKKDTQDTPDINRLLGVTGTAASVRS
jgi:succinoglycan biosynthesis transport protein ExoP